MTMSRRHKDNLIGALLVLCVATPIVWWTGDTAKKTDTTAETLARQQEGRKVAIEVLCGFASAVSDAGRKTIAGSVALPGRTKRDADRIVLDKHGRVIGVVSGRFARFLEAHGYPLAPQRFTGSRRAAEAYTRNLSTAVAAETHATGLVRPDGTLDCARLQKVSHAK
jgi:hypothetical protein